MPVDRAEVFRLAWAFAKSDLWSRRLPASHLRGLFRKALVRAWAQVKAMAAARAARAAQLAAARIRPAEDVRRDLLSFECKDTLRGSDWEHFNTLRAELSAAIIRVGFAAAA